MSSTASRTLRGSDANGADARTSACRSSTVIGSIATIDTICWASTSSGLLMTDDSSTAPTAIRSATTAEETRSPRYFGNITPWETAPTWCPARPIRCSPLATLGGASTCTTRSTAPMSMPSSSELVATTAGSRPDFSSSSTSARCDRETEPWWALARIGSAPAASPEPPGACGGHTELGRLAAPSRSPWISFSRAVSRSARRRELANTIVERCSPIRSTMRSSTCGQIEVRATSPAAGPGEVAGGLSEFGQIGHRDDDVELDPSSTPVAAPW